MKNRNKALIIASCIFLVIAVVFVILGFTLSGADVLAWFGSKYAWIFYTFGGLYLLVILIVLSKDWIKRL